MLSLSMVVIAALVGAGGLGVPVVRALNSVQVGMGFEAGFTHRIAGHHIGPHEQTVRTRSAAMNSAIEFKDVDILFRERGPRWTRRIARCARRARRRWNTH